MDRRPVIVLANYGGVRFFSGRELDRLDEIGEVIDHEALGSWDDPRSDELLAAVEVLVGHWGCPPIDAAVLDRAPRLRLFAYAAGSVKGTVDASIFDRAIRVTSGADANAEPVAEFTLAMVLLAGKDVLWRRELLRDPSLDGFRPPPPVPHGNWDKVVGVVGASLVGRRVIELLRNFPHLSVALHDPHVDDGEAARLGVRKVEIDELCETADVLTIHAPALPTTVGLVSATHLAALRTGATVINTARGSLLDHEALIAELERGRLYAVLDVTDPEPLPAEHRLRSLPNVFLTPHLAGSEGTELRRMAEHVTDEVRRWAAGEPARNEVTRDRWDRLA